MEKNKLILVSDIDSFWVKNFFLTVENLQVFKNKTAVFLFLESSTRTKISFEMACYKLGMNVVHFNQKTSSTNKGESLAETLRNIEAMGADLLVVRHGADQLDIKELYSLKIPVISAGSGSVSHPTQALLDLFTLHKEGLVNKNKNLLFLGDVSLNRVANSHKNLLPDWGFKLAYCCPEECCTTPPPKELNYFENKQEALDWADIVMVLRLQEERKNFSVKFLENYKKNYQLRLKDIEKANETKQEPLKVMHPGPYVEGLDLEKAVTDYEHSFIYKQVSHSVPARAAIIQCLLQKV
ncbi:MAG: aspartate carbamoyltransferase [Bdellovibrionaceae bacterium]|nr:aspartate carbamoyltransferase [Pseudobdellovibrionaceae bacterium]